ncbi:MAG: pantoate--beta-alanine ligase [Pseudobdellovibrionaceae bacterium]|jgi:pantoate--beta-alanine ligase|nr:pantoate--beta-alanine ligase [Pseudobdellovibrionaceae bacterium]
MVQILKTPEDLRTFSRSLRAQNKTLGFVPTMGALHEGHLTLARTALADCDAGIVSIFVNPKQFAPHEDFDRYPRQLEQDAKLLSTVGIGAVFAPEIDVMYPKDFQTTVSLSQVTKPLEGEFRPTHFAGVSTVVARLLLLVGADKAYFGEKDYQQLQLIKQMAKDLAIPTEIVGVEIVRESSGLALSSRNAYLTAEERPIADQLNVILKTMAAEFKSGDAISDIENRAAQKLLRIGFGKIDYITIRDANTLLPPTTQTKSHRILAAAFLGRTRLIDNIATD